MGLSYLKNKFSVIAILGLVLSNLAFIPTSYAVTSLSFHQAPANFIDVSSDATMYFLVKLTGFEKNVDVHFNIYADGVDEPLYNQFTSYQANTTKQFAWDGKSFGEDMPPGKYRATFHGIGLQTLTHYFEIVPDGTQLRFNPAPKEEYIVGGVPYEIKVTHVTQEAPIDVKVTVGKLGNIFSTTLVDTHKFTSFNETYTYKWDGKIGNQLAEPGDYKLFVTIGNSNSATLFHEFTVKKTPALSFSETPADVLNVKKGQVLDFKVKLENFEQNVAIDFFIKPPTENAYKYKTIQYTGNQTQTFQWDGEKNGEDMPPGIYEATFSGQGIAPLTHPFYVVHAEPKIDFTSSAPTQHVLGSGNYKVSVDLDDYAADTTVTASMIVSDAAIYIPQTEHVYKANGTHEFSWDVSDLEPATYSIQIGGEDTQGNPTNVLEYDLEILAASDQPMLSFSPTPPISHIIGSGNYKASVKASNINSDTLVKAYVLDPENNQEVEKGSFTFTTNNEVHEFDIDLSDYDAGNYQLRIYGKNQEGIETNNLTHQINITGNIVVDDNERCAGYYDLKKTDWSCPAAEWAKAEGIITGQENGRFIDGYSFLNRAEVAKIALMAHKKYSANTDYCNGIKPFTDVMLGQWYTGYICLGKNLKMITGYLAPPDAGKYAPARPVTLTEMFCLVVRPLNENMPQGASYPGLATNQWYSGCAKFVKDHNYFDANTILPTTEATRFNVLNFLYALHLDGKL